jgi:hypothetical protein
VFLCISNINECHSLPPCMGNNTTS